ncbi:MAG TPA: phosphonate ABC transporter ATP-binding protein [Thermodesulfobacteriota bacterium]|nr:phosphonate ABC transporter ATP-binding protein [Thermodesulfobacteriota bacterium]
MSPSGRGAAVEIDNLWVTYPNGVTALRGVTLALGPGEFVAVVGPSGAGKTTLMRCINGLTRPTRGSVRVGGVEVVGAPAATLRAVRRDVAMIFQQFNLVRRSSVLRNVACGRLAELGWLRSLLGLFRREDLEAAYGVLVELGLGDKALRRADTLSGGEQQRVAIARALVQRPRVILADEPAASLDIRLTRVVLDTLREVNRKEGLTVVVNLHLLDLAREYAGRIVSLKEGEVVHDGPPADLDERAATRIYGHGPSHLKLAKPTP